VAKSAPTAALGTHLQTKANLGGRLTSRVLLLPPADGERPGLLDRIEVLIELKVGLAVVIHQAVSPWLVAAAHRQGGGHRFRAQLGGGWIGLGDGEDHHWGLQGLLPALRSSAQSLRAYARLSSRRDFSSGIS